MIILFLISSMLCHWLETSQADFADGIFEKNIYASHRKCGAVEFVPRFDLNLDGYLELFSSSRHEDKTWVYWGSESGYSVNNRTGYQAITGGNSDAADFNLDGYPDLITCGLNDNVRIFPGGPNGPNPSNFYELFIPGKYNETGFFADLNKDGWLDIVVGARTDNFAAIFWGSREGYTDQNRLDLPIHIGCHNIEIADLDKDGFLDILIPNDNIQYNTIYWGSDSGYSPSNILELKNPGNPHGITVVDLNGDDFLDLIFTSRTYDQAYIYFGYGREFELAYILNPGQNTLGGSYGGSSIADFNDDGYKDIFFFSPGKTVIYWGSTAGYSDANRTFLNRSAWASCGFVADLNFDGYYDVFVGNWGWDGVCYIAWGPDFSTFTSLGADYDHHGMFREIGNVYDRGYYEDYISSIFDAGHKTKWLKLSWHDSLPKGTEISIAVRTGNTPIPDSSWSDWVEVPNGGNIPSGLKSRYIQYKAHMVYTNPAYLPVLWDVKITFTGLEPSVNVENSKIASTALSVYPNPMRNFTSCQVTLAEPSRISLRIYNEMGELIKTLVDRKTLEVGSYTFRWDGHDRNGFCCPSGIYFLNSEFENANRVRRITTKLLKVR